MDRPTNGRNMNLGTKFDESYGRGIEMGYTMNTNRENSYDTKKEEICYKAAEIFGRKGYEKTTLDEISAELKITKSGLYHYFSGKQDILFHCLIKAHSMANEALSKIVDRRGLHPREKLRLAIKEHVKVLTTRFVYLTLRQQELLLPKGLRDEVREARSKFQQMFVGIIQEGIEQGCFQADNLKLISFAILGSVNWVARWYAPDGPFTPDEISEVFCNLIFRGINT